MKARYFRMRFSNNERGIYHTLAYRDEMQGENLHLSYVGEGGQEPSVTHYPIDVLVAADLGEETLRQVTILLKNHPVKELYLPVGEESLPVLDEMAAGVDQLRFLKEGEIHCWKRGLWEFRILNLGRELSLYHGYTGTKDLREDCAFCGRVYDPADPCSPCLLEERDFCGFACMRHRDLHLIKAHLDSKYQGFRVGALLLSRGVFRGKISELLERIKDYKERIRAVHLPANLETWERELLDLAPEREIQYYVGHTGYRSEIPGDIVSHSGYCHYVPANLENGLCLSGYFVPFVREKDC